MNLLRRAFDGEVRGKPLQITLRRSPEGFDLLLGGFDDTLALLFTRLLDGLLMLLLRLQLAPMFWEGMRLLDSRRRNAVLLRDGLELSIEIVAQLLELPLPETVRLLHEGRLMLRGLMDHLYFAGAEP